MLSKSSLFAIALFVAAPLFGAALQGGVDEAQAQNRTTTTTSSGSAGIPSTTGTTFPATPSATTAPYQSGSPPAYSSWPPSTPSTPGYRSTQPTYQTNPNAVLASPNTSATNSAACSPSFPAGATSATGTTTAAATGVGCP